MNRGRRPLEAAPARVAPKQSGLVGLGKWAWAAVPTVENECARVSGCDGKAKSLISKMKTRDFKMVSGEGCGGAGGGKGGGWRDVEAFKYLLDTDVSFVPEVSLETQQVQGAGERPGPSPLGSLPSGAGGRGVRAI